MIQRFNERNYDPWKSLFTELETLGEAMKETFNDKFRNMGLKNYIERPHNLLTYKDENGDVIGFSLQVVYTPFKKSDVKVEILDNVLTIKCGTENIDRDPNMVYCGISNQSKTYSLPLNDTVDTAKITAKAEDGILYIDMPVKKVEKLEPKPIQIEVV